jgi:hypothetical protein
MKRSFGYKLLLVGCLMLLGPYVLTEFLGINPVPIQILISTSYAFGLMIMAIAAYMIYYRGKTKR